MSISIQDVLAELQPSSIQRLCDIRGVRARSRDDKTSGLAASYQGRHVELFDDLLKEDLARLLYQPPRISEDEWYLPNARSHGVHELRQFAIDFLRDGKIPEEFICPSYEGEESETDVADDENDYDSTNDSEDSNEESEEEESEPASDWRDEVLIRVDPDGEPPDGLQFVSRKLFPHQQDATDRLGEWYGRGTSSGILCLPTGGGKTRTAVQFLLQYVIGRGKRVLWLAHRQELINQAVAAFVENGGCANRAFSVGRFEAGSRKVDEPTDVVIASVQTISQWRNEGVGLINLAKLERTHSRFDVVVVDECHHAVAKTWKRLIKQLRKKKSRVLGLTATPTRTGTHERSELKQLLGDIVYEAHITDLIRHGILAKPVITPIRTGLSFHGNTADSDHFSKYKDLSARLVKQIGNDENRNRAIVQTYLDRQEEWGQTLFFSATVEQAHHLAKMLTNHGVAAEALDGAMDVETRRDIVNAFTDHRLQVVVNVLVFSEGTDLPAVNSVFITRPTRSEILFRQMVGRGMRGPMIDGTATCNVVAFYDTLEIVGQVFATSFTTAHEALEALGTSEEEILETPSTEDVIDAVPPFGACSADKEQAVGLRVQELRAYLAQLPLNSTNWTPPVDIPLLGWWVAAESSQLGGEGQRRALLPVFREDEEALTFRIQYLRGLLAGLPISAFQLEELRWISDEMWTGFESAVRRWWSEPRFVSLGGITKDHATIALDAMLDLGRVDDGSHGLQQPSIAKATVSPVEPSSRDVFMAIRSFFAKNREAATKAQTVFVFKLRSPDSAWTLDTKTGVVREGEAAVAECTLELSDADFIAMVRGSATPSILFTSGRLKVSGDILASQKLAFLEKIDEADILAAAAARAGGRVEPTMATAGIVQTLSASSTRNETPNEDSAARWGGVREIWMELSRDLPPQPDEHHLRFFWRVANVLLRERQIPEEFATPLLERALMTGEPPTPPQPRPTLTQIASELRALSAVERTDAIARYHTEFFAEAYPTREAFLEALLFAGR